MKSAKLLIVAALVGGAAAAWVAPAGAQTKADFTRRSPSECEMSAALLGGGCGNEAGTRSLELGTVPVAEPVQAAPPPPPTPEKPRVAALNIPFDYDSATLRPEARETLDRLARVLRSERAAGSRFVVEGHTDARGAPDYNFRLSERRARSVVEYLVHSCGVDAAQVTWQGKGKAQPLNPIDPLAPENRRVEVMNIGS